MHHQRFEELSGIAPAALQSRAVAAVERASGFSVAWAKIVEISTSTGLEGAAPRASLDSHSAFKRGFDAGFIRGRDA